jgi:hypothetical protein
MWFVANQTAPFGREIPLSKAIIAIIFMGLCGAASGYWLKPLIGEWKILVDLVAWTIVAMLVLGLTFRRALLAVIIYFAVVFAASLLMVMDVRYHHNHGTASGQSSKQSTEPTAIGASVSQAGIPALSV